MKRQPPVVRAAAKRDIREARNWYLQISPELGESFIAAVDHAIALADERPQAFQTIYKSLRRVLLRRFQYAVFYTTRESRIVLVAVLHQARDLRAAFRRT